MSTSIPIVQLKNLDISKPQLGCSCETTHAPVQMATVMYDGVKFPFGTAIYGMTRTEDDVEIARWELNCELSESQVSKIEQINEIFIRKTQRVVNTSH
jgi:hypothetical protein